MKSLIRSTMVSGLLATSGGAAFAQTANYTFEAPIFTMPSASPNGLLNKSPNSGSSGIMANFTSSPTATAAQIDDNGNGVNTPNDPALFSTNFSGQFLNSVDNNQSITVSLNTAFTNLSVDFYLDGPGTLNLTSSGVSVLQAGAYDTATMNYVGVLNFASATPFTSFTLATAATTGARPGSFGIDNLQLSTPSSNPTPTPSSALILGAGLLYPLAGLVKRRREKSA